MAVDSRGGLLSTTVLLDLYELRGEPRAAIESRRPQEVGRDPSPDARTAWIRDNLPVNETVLRRTLVGIAEEQYYRTLNGRVFFWVSMRRLEKLRNAPPYRDRLHDILELDTAALMLRYADIVELSHLNSGAVHPAANYPRGTSTFRPIGSYPWGERKTASSEPLVEVTVPYSVPDVADFVVSVTTR